MRIGIYLVFFLTMSGMGSCRDWSGKDQSVAPDTTEAAEQVEKETQRARYEVTVQGAVTDTLQGRARFGTIFDPDTRKEQLVIKLESAIDFTGGVVLSNGAMDRPGPGSYETTSLAEADSLGYNNRFVIAYRKDISREFSSTSGSVTIDTSTDTLITGSFDSILRGTLIQGSRIDKDQEIRIRGRFSATPGSAGYIIGF